MDESFPRANVLLSDMSLIAGDRQFALSDISYAEVVTTRQRVDWRTFIEVHSLLFLATGVGWALLSTLGWISVAGPVFAIYWLIRTLYDAQNERKKAYKHTLTLETLHGTAEVATSEDDDPLLEACEAINRRIKKAAARKPQQSGEPTRWIKAN